MIIGRAIFPNCVEGKLCHLSLVSFANLHYFRPNILIRLVAPYLAGKMLAKRTRSKVIRMLHEQQLVQFSALDSLYALAVLVECAIFTLIEYWRFKKYF